MANKSSVGIFGGKSQPKIIFFLQTETDPEKSYEISEDVLFRRLLSEKTAKEVGDAQHNETSKILKGIDLKSTISQVETHKSRNVGQIESENIFVVFQTISSKENRQYWWSLEESTESVAMQRSQEKSAVINKFKGKIRNQVETIADGLKGKGSIKDFLILLWIHIVIDLKCQSFLSRCESFIPLVMKKITETFYEYPPNYFTYSALSSEEINPQLEEIVNFLTKVTKWHPLLCLTYLGDIHQFDRVLGNGFFKTKIDGIYNRLTLLNAAILFCKTGMVKHVLEKKKANARKRDQTGRNALNMAALFTDEEEIIKLLLSFQIKDKLNIKDKSGMTAFHYAVISSNLTVARHLIDHGADFKRLDATGHSPLHLAAHYAKDSQILELLLTKVEIDQCDFNGITALHSAAIASNAISARYLIERGADINRVDKRGRTPVHVAAALAKNMDFFNILLSNEKADLECCDERKLTVLAYAKINQFGLAKEIVSGIEKKNNDKRSEYSQYIAHNKVDDVDDVDGDGRTALHLAASVSNVIAVRKLIEKEANPYTFDKEGLLSPLHVEAQQRDVAANADLGNTVSTENDVNWNELLAPAPMGIAVMSQLLICSYRVRDFKICNINKEAIPLMKHPESFRTTLVQITNECYEAFIKALINMERIELTTEMVPDYIRYFIKYMQSGNKKVVQKFNQSIKEVATRGQELSKEVCDTFDKLGQLIRQVITASVKTMGDHEIADTIGEKTKDVEKAKKEEQEKLKREIEKANATVREKQNYLDGIRERKWDFWLRRIGCESKDKSLVYAQQMKEEAENTLKELKAEKEVCEKNIDKILKDNIERLEKMGIDANNAISPKQAIETLKEGLEYLAELQKQWAGITLYFNKIKNHLTETTAKNLEDFIDNANVAQEGSEEYELVMPDSIKESLQSSHKMHHSAKMYVKVSKNYIIMSINLMHGMLALPPNELVASQHKLIASCKEASKGIKDMYTEDNNNTIREIEVLANLQKAEQLKAFSIS